MSRAAGRYAKAILDLAQSQNIASEVNNDMKSIVDAFAQSTELQAFIASPTLPLTVKHQTLLEIFGGAQNVTKGLFRLLEENKRFDLITDIANQYVIQFDELSGVEVAKVTTAVPLDAELEARILAKAAEFTTKKVVIESAVDPSLIGGFILRIGDKQLNASVASRLQAIKQELNA